MTDNNTKRRSSQSNKSPPRKSQSLQSNNHPIKKRRSSQNNGIITIPYMNTSIGNGLNNQSQSPFGNEESIQLLQNSPLVKINVFFDVCCRCCWICEVIHCISVIINDKEHIIFRCSDSSNCCVRSLCSSKSRSLDIKWILPNKDIFAYSEKQCDCNCCCLGTPVLKNTYKNNKSLGFIDEKCRLYSPYYYIFDKKDNLKYSVEIPCCQCSFYCRHCCGKYSSYSGYIYNKDNLNECVGTIEVSERVYIIHFPLNANVEDKMNLISCIILFSYSYYSSRK